MINANFMMREETAMSLKLIESSALDVGSSVGRD